MLDHDSGHSVDLQKYVRTPVVQLVRIGRLAIDHPNIFSIQITCIGTTAGIFVMP
jgi:hypothetical protein